MIPCTPIPQLHPWITWVQEIGAWIIQTPARLSGYETGLDQFYTFCQ